ncbi:carbonic anhydrase [Musca domestica]|uniref:Carbonic anhydrase n=1 Tax=Musca domestica TaxID=7370 RepID=A0A9J7CXC2_MUSDO|nr:carbonic anhydrase [Musca domestica]
MLAFQLWLFATAIVSCVYGESEFTYYGSMGPDHWSEHYNQCAGKHQSPININDVDVIDRRYPEIKYEKFDKKPLNATMTNNGHTVQVKLIYDGQAPMVSGGPLAGKGNYEFQQLHFHWGEDNTVGSEDRINNVSFPMELHIVFRNIRYKDFAEATQRDDGVAVMAFFYEISSDQAADHDYDTFTSNLGKIEEPNSVANMDALTLFGLMPDNLNSYYTYIGSLTTPPCSEDVIWMDFNTPIGIASKLLDRFRSLKTFDGSSLTHNFRPVQPLNNRKVYRAKKEMLLPQEGGASSIPIVDAWDAAPTFAQPIVLVGILAVACVYINH